jgi:hypothetical protein
VRRCVLCALVALAPVQGRADGIAIVGGSPRAIGRAGTATVGDDGGGALLINPAAMARRDTTRAELGASTIEDDIEWLTDTRGAPRSVGRAGSRAAPLGAVIGALGNWVLGVGVMTAAVVARSLPRPSDVVADEKSLSNDLDHRYDYRYAGIAGSYRRDTVVVGAARRFGDSLALGASFGVARVHVTEHRRIFAARGAVAIGSPLGDVDLLFDATDPLSVSAVAGLLYAPIEAPIEIGGSVSWTRTVALDGTVDARQAQSGPELTKTPMPTADMRVAQPIAVRAGGRYVGDRVVAELDGDVWIAARGSDTAAWQVSGVRVDTPSYPGADLWRVPSRISQHSHVAVRASVDVSIVPGFLWVTTGYAFASRVTPAAQMSPSFGDLGGHTAALGLEVTTGGFTATLGWSRTWSPATSAPSALRLDNPFYGVDGPVPSGTYSGQVDQVGVLIDAELGGR